MCDELDKVESESQNDVFPFNLKPSNSSFERKEKNGSQKKEDQSKPKVLFDPEDYDYNMTGEKRLVIFNHFKYDNDSAFYRTDPHANRQGTYEDVKKLHETFSKLGFNIDTYHDETFETIWNVVLGLADEDFSSTSCLGIAILTHGSKRDQLCAYDRPYDLKHVLKLFEGLESLAGKPKLFLVQACRGKNTDPGVRIATDGGGSDNVVMTPSHSDFLVVRSTVEDYLSYRDGRGSWLIQELCKAIQRHRQEYDILQLMTIVQRKIAHGYITYTKKEATNNKVQMPETTFTLTKFLKF